MTEGFLVWSLFGALGAVIVWAGPRLSRYGDAIAEKTGLESSWIGVILLAFVTSLPEVASSAAAAVLRLPDIVFGNVFGSNLFNVVIIAMLDLMTPKPPILDRAGGANLLVSSYGVKMMALALIPLVLYNIPGLGFAPVKLFGVIDISSLLLIAVYIVGMRSIFLQQHALPPKTVKGPAPPKYAALSSGRTKALFAIFAVVIIAAGIGMSVLADRISGYEIPIGGGVPIGQSLVGVILLAVVTSLPEVMVSVGALRLGAVDMAVGNVLGSNMFNMLIIGISDFFYSAGSILNRPTVTADERVTGLASHLVVGLAGIIMLGVVSAGLSARGRGERRISLSTPLLIAIFLLTYVLIFMIHFG